MAVDVGDKAPDFTLLTDDGTSVTLSKLKQPVVLYFYPKDNTPGCTKESCDFRDNFAAFKKKGALVFGISKDSAKSHSKFKEKFQLPFPLLVDEDGKVCTAYGVISKKTMFGKIFKGIERSTFLIDANRVIRGAWRKVKVAGHAEQVLDELK